MPMPGPEQLQHVGLVQLEELLGSLPGEPDTQPQTLVAISRRVSEMSAYTEETYQAALGLLATHQARLENEGTTTVLAGQLHAISGSLYRVTET